MNKPMDLYMGKCINDLIYKLPDLKNKKINQMCNSAVTLYKAAETFQSKGDEEMAYISYMKFIGLVYHLKAIPNYSIQNEYLTKMIGRSKVMEALDRAEVLSKSLQDRYQSQKETDNNLNGSDECNKKNSVPKTMEFTSSELYGLMRDNKIGLLIMDCRSESDFEKSRLTYKNCLNVPEEMIQEGVTAGRIQNEIKQEMKILWASRAIKEFIVLMDWDSTTKCLKSNSPINILKNILLNWDQDVTYKNPLLILEGGYEAFLVMYPMMTTNSEYTKPKTKNDEGTLEEIEYPSINDITMKDDNIFPSMNQNNIPIIDRSSKETAIQALHEKEALCDKSLKNEKAGFSVQTELNQVQLDVLNASTMLEDKRELLAREQELEYELLEIKNKEKDYQLKRKELRKKISEYDEMNNHNAMQLEVETSNRIAFKEMEEQKITEKSKLLEKEREELALAREQKRHMKEPCDIDIVPKKQQPLFDRTIKPSVIYSDNIVRDFSPEIGFAGRGLTGLKNLGNTCYMNSIMQCLSNTTCLVDYLITGSYRKHINRSNKTQGNIVEEVSAVMKEIWCEKYKCIASNDLRYIVGQFQQIFRGMDQQDSHEFLVILMDLMHSELQTIDVVETPNETMSAATKAWKKFIKCKESYILKLFYGQIKSLVKCVFCAKESATYEGFSNLSLELPADSDQCVITNCLDMYFNGERIKGWNCPDCKQKREAIKKLDISKLPPILVIHLKRFYIDESKSNVYKKKQTYVKFPITNMDITNYIAPSEVKLASHRLYNLYGVSNHYGTMDRGHYTAFCKSSVFNKWFKYDDHRVSQLDQSDVVSSAAYILFYTTHTEMPPSKLS